MKMKKESKEANSSGSKSQGGADKSKYKSLEMSVFDRNNPESWLYQAEMYFEIHELSNPKKLKVVVIRFAPIVAD